MNDQHVVIFDYAGFRGHPRLTCNSCDVTLLKKPYMTLQMWQELVKEFAESHPSEISDHYNKIINAEEKI